MFLKCRYKGGSQGAEQHGQVDIYPPGSDASMIYVRIEAVGAFSFLNIPAVPDVSPLTSAGLLGTSGFPSASCTVQEHVSRLHVRPGTASLGRFRGVPRLRQHGRVPKLTSLGLSKRSSSHEGTASRPISGTHQSTGNLQEAPRPPDTVL
ncbi:uncharacterized protein B0I36DRAFT_107029 [Microdochium trichocladiopsis]|uniref:Uncharacterized protein n=1 Tax=Microdochium trichocladiopsis TaxID=1682393 RepID=A0A9P8YBR5_9PEZI|nr:uncharacterized protein B0I36DRAFT_107029 [Microdochium trichocladiopsis]KAH7033277.1 hypothetical protein B0I36DRAFT_107029 [Microdochium trichocladiopsis]